jgi:hypothetical protein
MKGHLAFGDIVLGDPDRGFPHGGGQDFLKVKHPRKALTRTQKLGIEAT